MWMSESLGAETGEGSEFRECAHGRGDSPRRFDNNGDGKGEVVQQFEGLWFH